MKDRWFPESQSNLFEVAGSGTKFSRSFSRRRWHHDKKLAVMPSFFEPHNVRELIDCDNASRSGSMSVILPMLLVGGTNGL